MKRFTLTLALLILSGCSVVRIETPDGLKISSTSLFTDRGIDEAHYGRAYIKGYNSKTDTAGIEAAAKGAAAGVTAGAAKVVVP